MASQNSFSVIFLVLLFFWTASKGNDVFEGAFQGTPCFKRRYITGCNGTLITNFKQTAERIGSNIPDTSIFLFTRENPDEPEFLHECGGTLPSNTNFNSNFKTEVFVHGWLDGTCRTAWMREMRDQLFQRGEYNVILIDWTWGNTIDYAVSASNTRTVGQQIGFLLRNLMENGAKPADIHIIGHSFGSHIAGFAGKVVPGIGRITGLDPALAPFKDSPPEERMDRSDAILVDSIHSNGVDCAVLDGLGSIYPWSDADFYPNGGTEQSSCIPYIVTSLLKGDLLYGLFSIIPKFCFHLQSLQYYKVSINPGDCELIGHECHSYEGLKDGSCDTSCGEDGSRCAVMGMNFAESGFVKNVTGGSRKFYLDTGLKCPYCS